MKKLGHIAAALVLAAGVIYFIAVPKDDAEMAAFKQSTAAFIRSDKQSAPLKEVLGRGGDKICLNYDDKGKTEITIQDYKVLTIMSGRRDIVVDGKTWALTVDKSSACLNYAAAKFSKDGSALLLSGASSGSVKKPLQEKPKQKKKSAPPAVKKVTKPTRSYGY